VLPTLWNHTPSKPPAVFPYGGRSGFVAGSDTSQERASEDDTNGKTSARLEAVLEALIKVPQGLTWSELSRQLDLHHGQISGALSMLHKDGHVFALKIRREKSHPYVHGRFRSEFPSTHRFDEPVKTPSTIEKELRAVLLDAVDGVLAATSFDTIRVLRDARAAYLDGINR